MKRLIHLLAAGMLIIAITPGCKKSFSSLPLCNDSARLIAEAHKWFQLSVAAEVPAPGIQANPRINSPKSPVWDQARTLELSDRSVVIVPLHYKAPIYLMNHAANSPLFVIDQVARLVIYRDSLQNFRAEVVTALPDSSFSQDAPLPFHGLLLIENWSGTLLYRLHSDGRNLLISNPAQQPSTIAAGLITETCYEIVGYNYAADDPTNGESWTEDAGCNANYYFGTPSSSIGLTAKSYLDIGGGAEAPPPSPAGMFTVVSGDDPIADIRAYMKCFQNSAGSIYQVTLSVEQPVAGSRIPIYFPPIQFGGGFTIGHTFLIFQQTAANGVITIRSIGFYPKQAVTPTSPNGPGMLNDDEGQYSNIGLTITLSAQQFMNMISYAIGSADYSYNLNSYNCTTWALACLNAGGMNISTIQGQWLLGSGDDPGDLGEDIRNMPLSSGIKRYVTGLDAPRNAGNCQ